MSDKEFFAVDELGNRRRFNAESRGESVFLTLKKERFASAGMLRALGDFSLARIGEEGYYILPRNISMNGDIMVTFGERPDGVYSYRKPVMAWYGIKTPRVTAMVRFERSYRAGFEIQLRGGEYRVSLVYDFGRDDPPYEDIRLEVIEFPSSAGYAEMAAKERELRLARGEITTLAEKCGRPAVEYARKNPLIRIRMGWKQSPPSVLFQTPGNEPPMFVACDFARVRDIADALSAAGVPGAELQLVGWNIGGHDGRFPQLFPADERLGGNDGLRKTVEHVKALGYRISLHTNLIDAYTIADSFSYDDIVVLRDGTLFMPPHAHYGGGASHHVCPVCQRRNNARDLPAVAGLGTDGLHFIDVISIEEPDVCMSSRHPCSTLRGWEEKRKTLEQTRELMGGVSSEGCFDGVAGQIDYGLYVSFGDGFGHTEVPFCDRFLPIFELTYHSILLYNPTSPTVNYPVKTPADRLTFIMRGGRPSLYIYSKFRTGGSKNWMGETDLTAEDGEALRRTVEAAVSASEDSLRFADRQLIPMVNYEVLGGGLEVATYEDGVCIAGNFSDSPLSYRGKSIAPYGYAVI